MTTLAVKAGKSHLDSLKEKAKNGYQMVRLPRCGTTATLMAMQQLLPESKIVNLGEGCFSDMPFSWGPWHNGLIDFPYKIYPEHSDFKETMNIMRENRGFGEGEEVSDLMDKEPVLEKKRKVTTIPHDWIEDFNVRLDQKESYDPDKLTFQIVRNPYDWLTSIYSWNFMGINGIPSYLSYAFDLFKYSDDMDEKQKSIVVEKFTEKYPYEPNYNNFDEFIEYVFQHDADCSWEDKVSSPFPYPMMDKCFFQPFDNDGNCKADVFIRFEYLVPGIQSMLDWGGYDVSMRDVRIPWAANKKQTNWNANNKFNDYKHKFYTNQKTIERVKEVYSWDLNTFNYDFDGPTDQTSCFSIRGF